MTSPIAGQSLTRTRFSEQSLLVAADNFIATAGECIGGMAVISDLQASAARLEHELANYAPISSFGLGKVVIVSARIAHNGKKWESSNADLEVDVDKDGASLKLGVKASKLAVTPVPLLTFMQPETNNSPAVLERVPRRGPSSRSLFMQRLQSGLKARPCQSSKSRKCSPAARLLMIRRNGSPK